MDTVACRCCLSVRVNQWGCTHTNTNAHTHTHSLHKAHEIWIESKGEHQQIDTAGAQQPNNDSDDAFGVPVCFCTGVCICMRTCECVATPRCSGSEKPIHTQNVCCASCLRKLWELQNQRAGHTPLTKDTTTTTTSTPHYKCMQETADTKKWKYKWRTRLGE